MTARSVPIRQLADDWAARGVPELPARAWLRHVADVGRYPTESELEAAIEAERVAHVPLPGRSVKTIDGLLLDVTNTIRSPVNTGIERVVRNLANEWQGARRGTAVSWAAGLTRLVPVQVARDVPASTPGPFGRLAGNTRVVTALERVHADRLGRWVYTRSAGARSRGKEPSWVPDGAVLLLSETIAGRDSAVFSRIRALQSATPTSVAAIGYDLIPLAHPEWVSREARLMFLDYASTIGRGHAISCISGPSSAEFGHWTQLVGGDASVALHRLPSPEAPRSSDPGVAPNPDEVPLVLAVGALEPRKNFGLLLDVCERLWREQLAFRLVIVGAPRFGAGALLQRIDSLRRGGRPIALMGGLSDAELWTLYRQARLLVQPSLAEGYGLPPFEALRAGTPVVVSPVGAMGDLGVDDGALRIETWEVDDWSRAVRSLLTDSRLHADLATAARSSPVKSWKSYADEVADFLEAESPWVG